VLQKCYPPSHSVPALFILSFVQRVAELSQNTRSDSAEVVDFLDEMQMKAAEDEQNQHRLLVSTLFVPSQPKRSCFTFKI